MNNNKNFNFSNSNNDLNEIAQYMKPLLKKLILSYKEQQNYYIKFIKIFPNFSKIDKINSLKETSYLLKILDIPFGSLFLNQQFYSILLNEIEKINNADSINDEYENEEENDYEQTEENDFEEEEEENENENENDDNLIVSIKEFLYTLVDIFNFPIFYDKSEMFKNLYLNYMNDDDENLEANIRYDLNLVEKLYSDFNLIENNIYNSKNLSSYEKNNINKALNDYSNDVKILQNNKNTYNSTIEYYNNNLDYLIKISKQFGIFNLNCINDEENNNILSDDEFF